MSVVVARYQRSEWGLYLEAAVVARARSPGVDYLENPPVDEWILQPSAQKRMAHLRLV